MFRICSGEMHTQTPIQETGTILFSFSKPFKTRLQLTFRNNFIKLKQIAQHLMSLKKTFDMFFSCNQRRLQIKSSCFFAPKNTHHTHEKK